MRPLTGRLGAGIAVAGLAALVTGTFLPWLRSGSVLRSSYQALGALRALVGDPVPALLAAWLTVIPLCAVCVALYALRFCRTSAWVTCVTSACVGTTAGMIVVQDGSPGSLVGVVPTGPVVTLVGAVLSPLGAITVLIGLRGGHPGVAGG